MDKEIEFNKARWEELSKENVAYSIPFLDLDQEKASLVIDPEKQLSVVKGKRVLCLAASGGQQSAAFGILGADVTVVDISKNQLEKDILAAKHYGIRIRTIEGDMQDLAFIKKEWFDIIWLAHSLNFVPNAKIVIKNISQLCRKEGRIRIAFTNPYIHGAWEDMTENGFEVTRPYIDGARIEYKDPFWEFKDQNGDKKKVEGPNEYRHLLSTIINSLIENGLEINGFWEDGKQSGEGNWARFTQLAPPWNIIWATRKKST